MISKCVEQEGGETHTYLY